MLAYLFWHWARPDVVVAEYEAALVDFHASLAATGLLGSTSWAVSGLPWLPVTAAGYSDWYLVDDFAALGTLNEAAVSPPCRPAHDRVAAMSGGGCGGVYRLRAGDADLVAGGEAWFDKDEGLDLLMADTLEPGRALWQRQLVLGPAPEFCLLSSRPAPRQNFLALPRRAVIGPN